MSAPWARPPGGSWLADPVALLDRGARRFGSRPFLRGSGTDGAGEVQVTYAAAATAVERLAWTLGELGVAPRDRVAVAAWNSVEWVVLALAVARRGAVLVPLHAESTATTLRRVLRECAPTIAVGSPAAPAAGRWMPLGKLLPKRWHDPAGVWRAPPPVVAAGDDEPFALIYTSGSSGESRGVVVTHGNVRFSTEAIQRRLGYRADDTVGLCLPLCFDYGLYQVFLTLLAGACLHVADMRVRGFALGAMLARAPVTVLPLVPSQVAALVTLLRRRPGALADVRALTSTGDHLPGRLVDRLRAAAPRVAVYPMYGLTECKRATIMLPDEHDSRPGSVGRPLGGTRVLAVDDSGRHLPPGTRGELVVEGPNVTAGYWRQPEATRTAFEVTSSGRSRLRTGDYGWVDDDAFVWVHGRTDALCNRDGHRFSLLEVERAASAVADEAVAVLAGGAVHLFARLASGRSRARLLACLRERLEPYKLPDTVHVLGELPLTSNLKIDRAALRARCTA